MQVVEQRLCCCSVSNMLEQYVLGLPKSLPDITRLPNAMQSVRLVCCMQITSS